MATKVLLPISLPEKLRGLGHLSRVLGKLVSFELKVARVLQHFSLIVLLLGPVKIVFVAMILST